MRTQDIGLDLAALGSFISVIGVIANNIAHDFKLAMMIWCVSNLIMTIYFYGHWKQWWDGGISSQIIFGMYVLFTISGIYGLVFYV
jgi:hypothetical protein